MEVCSASSGSDGMIRKPLSRKKNFCSLQVNPDVLYGSPQTYVSSIAGINLRRKRGDETKVVGIGC